MIKPLVTCCVLSFNNTEYLIDNIDSIIKQTYNNIEILICDDCSKVFPYEKIDKQLKKSGLKYKILVNSTNQGTVKNVNKGVNEASGDIILTIAADDVLYDENVIQQIVDIQKNSGYEIFSMRRMLCTKEDLTPIELIPSSKNIKKVKRLDTAEKQFIAIANRNYYGFVSGSCLCYTRSFLDKMGLFDEDYTLVEDAPIIIKYLRSGKFIPCEFDIICLKYRDGGISNSAISKESKLFKDGSMLYEKDILPYINNIGWYQRSIIQSTYAFRFLEKKIKRGLYLLTHPLFLIHKIHISVSR